ncbi:MAG: hypothetical protein AAGA99_02275 [Actinomycetota bacterium]
MSADVYNVDGGIDEIPVSADGRLWLCGKHLIGPDVEGVMARVGANAVVCLTERRELTERYPDYVAWLDREIDRRAIWRPIPDLSAPPLEDLLPFLTALADRLRDGDGLIVHCAAGIGRSGTSAVALSMLLGSSRADAERTVAEHRALAGPESGSQTELIDALELHLAGG